MGTDEKQLFVAEDSCSGPGTLGLLWPPCSWHCQGLAVSLWLPGMDVANPEIQPVHLWGQCKHLDCSDPCFFLNIIVFFSPSSAQFCFLSQTFKIFNAFAISRNTGLVCFLPLGTLCLIGDWDAAIFPAGRRGSAAASRRHCGLSVCSVVRHQGVVTTSVHGSVTVHQPLDWRVTCIRSACCHNSVSGCCYFSLFLKWRNRGPEGLGPRGAAVAAILRMSSVVQVRNSRWERLDSQ